MTGKTIDIDFTFTVPDPVETAVRELVRKSYQIAREEARTADYRPAISPEAVLGALLHFAPSFVGDGFEAASGPPEEEAPKASKKGKKPEADA